MTLLRNPTAWSVCLIGWAVCLADARPAAAQLKRGFAVKLDSSATGEELNAQSDLWVMEITYKPIRMVSVMLTDPKTGKKTRRLVWYLVYKAVNRPLPSVVNSDTAPANDEDPPPGPKLFIPEFTLVTDDNGNVKTYPDVILPEAQAAIEKRERMKLKNPVQAVGPLPAGTPLDADKEDAIYGVVMWRSVDLATDYFTVYMTGFSNGYRIQPDPEGPLVHRKTIQQDYWRPGDRFDPDEVEIRHRGEPKWFYRVDAAPAQSAGNGNNGPADVKPPVPNQPNGAQPAAPSANKADDSTA